MARAAQQSPMVKTTLASRVADSLVAFILEEGSRTAICSPRPQSLPIAMASAAPCSGKLSLI